MTELILNLKENFTGRVCTILTQPVSFQFSDPVQHSQYFTGQVVEINEYGVWLKHLHIDTYAFFAFPIIGIVEEQTIAHDDPRADEIKKTMNKKKEEPAKPVVKNIPAQNFIPIESLTKMVKDSKKK